MGGGAWIETSSSCRSHEAAIIRVMDADRLERELLAARTDVRDALGASAAELVRRDHDVERVADLYVAALETAAGGAVVDDAVLSDVSAAAADVGISAETAEAREIARRLAEVELG